MSTGERTVLLALLTAFSLGTRVSAQAGQSAVDLSQLSDPVRLERQLRAAGAAPVVTAGTVRHGGFRLPAGQTFSGNLLVVRGTTDIAGRLAGNLVVLDGDVVLQPGGVVTGDALSLGGAILDRGGVIQGERRTLGRSGVPAAEPGHLSRVMIRGVGVFGVFFTLVLLGFGFVLFAHPQLETISDTVSHSLLRSFVTGLLAQVVVIPTIGLMVTGLVLSVVGILLVPFVLIVAPLLVGAAALAGFLAVAHAMGEKQVRHRAAAGARIGSANSYRYVLLGLLIVAAIWGGWVLVGWVPVAGTLVFSAAFLATWLLGTIGFGAALLSRGGIRPAFAGRYVPPEALTDEYLWATPQFGVDAVKRPLKK